MSKTPVIIRNVKEKNIKEVLAEMLEAIDWQEIVKKDCRIVIKPNLSAETEDKAPHSNSDPIIIDALLDILKEVTNEIVIVESNGLRYEADLAFKVTGLESISNKYNVPFVNLTNHQDKSINHRIFNKYKTKFSNILLDADVVINIPVIKTHALTVLTGAVKNLWGCVPQYDRILMHKYLDRLLADLVDIVKPQINIMDGILCSEGRGPTSGTPRRLDLLLVSRDAVALDATTMRLIGFDPFTSRPLVLAAKNNYGKINKEDIIIYGDFEKLKVDFVPPISDIAVKMMNYFTRYRFFTHQILINPWIFKMVKKLVVILRKIGILNDSPESPTKQYSLY
jgi:uncharacterized protein (DUF362 family)